MDSLTDIAHLTVFEEKNGHGNLWSSKSAVKFDRSRK